MNQFGKTPAPGSTVVGESWEVSVEPSFPSRGEETGGTLAQQVLRDPEAWIGPRAAERFQLPHLLTKLLDAEENLSVQVHPRIYTDLDSNEGGKFESWIILDHEPGAGIYLGFTHGTTAADIIREIQSGGNVANLMNFVPVSVGDVFHIEPGTPHAVGRGVTLFEPQSVRPAARSITYRCWDWNRLYDENGVEAADGTSRQIHLREFIEVTDWHRVTSKSFVRTCTETPKRYESGGLSFESISQAHWYTVDRISGTGTVNRMTEDHFVGITCLSGTVEIITDDTCLTLTRGRSAAIPAAIRHFELSVQDGELFAIWDTPEKGRSYPSRIGGA